MEEIKKVYGPYVVTDPNSTIYGRKQVYIVYTSGRKRTTLYSRHLMEQHLGRELDPNLETVDHIDKDPTNDNIENLRILSRAEHASQDNIRNALTEIVCIWCGKSALKEARNLDHNSKLGKAGPFCGRSCSGKYGSAVQNGSIAPLPPQANGYKREYFYLDKESGTLEAVDTQKIERIKTNIDKVVKEALKAKEKKEKERLQAKEQREKKRKEIRERKDKEALKAKEQKQKEKEAKKKYCPCGKQISYRADKCKACSNKIRATVIQWPEPQEVLRMVQATNFSKAGKELGVSDNAIRKFLKKHELSV